MRNDYGNPLTLKMNLLAEIKEIRESIDKDRAKITRKEEVINLLERAFSYIEQNKKTERHKNMRIKKIL